MSERELTKRIVDWMRKRAGENVSFAAPYLRGWHDALLEVAEEIEDNEREGCDGGAA